MFHLFKRVFKGIGTGATVDAFTGLNTETIGGMWQPHLTIQNQLRTTGGLIKTKRNHATLDVLGQTPQDLLGQVVTTPLAKKG